MHRRAFTLIEMITVSMVIALLASVVAPSLINLRRSNLIQKGVIDLQTLASRASDLSRTTGQTIVLSYDDASRQFSLAADETTITSNNPNAQSAPTNTLNPDQNASQNFGSITLPEGFRMNDSRAGDSNNVQSSWSTKFFADGTAQPSAIGLNIDEDRISMVVKRNGRVEFLRQEIPTEEADNWAAGELEQRAN